LWKIRRLCTLPWFYPGFTFGPRRDFFPLTADTSLVEIYFEVSAKFAPI
jgi:hypothetical protein